MRAITGQLPGSDGGRAALLDAAERDLGITYIGGSTVVLTIDGVSFITDPTFDPAGDGYASGTVRLQKTRGPALRPEQLGRLDVALISHDQHPDNLDTSGRTLLQAIPYILTTRAGAARLGQKATGPDPWQDWSVRTPRGTTLSVTATPARHGPVGIERISGDVIGFVIRRVEDGVDLVYATGDTVWYEGTREVAGRFRPRVVLAFAGDARVCGPFYLTMDSNDVIEAAAAFPDALIVPVHHDGRRHFTESQDDLIRTFQRLGRETQLRKVTGRETLRIA